MGEVESGAEGRFHRLLRGPGEVCGTGDGGTRVRWRGRKPTCNSGHARARSMNREGGRCGDNRMRGHELSDARVESVERARQIADVWDLAPPGSVGETSRASVPPFRFRPRSRAPQNPGLDIGGAGTRSNAGEHASQNATNARVSLVPEGRPPCGDPVKAGGRPCGRRCCRRRPRSRGRCPRGGRRRT